MQVWMQTIEETSDRFCRFPACSAPPPELARRSIDSRRELFPPLMAHISRFVNTAWQSTTDNEESSPALRLLVDTVKPRATTFTV